MRDSAGRTIEASGDDGAVLDKDGSDVAGETRGFDSDSVTDGKEVRVPVHEEDSFSASTRRASARIV